MALPTLLNEIEHLLGAGARAEGTHERLFGKDGLFRRGYKELKILAPAQRREYGTKLQELEHRATVLIPNQAPDEQKIAQTLSRYFDPTLPGIHRSEGHLHPLTIMTHKVVEYFERLNYAVILGTEQETANYNFDRLNIPKTHPAREAHDTIWLNREKEILLRTHTSPVQVHVMESQKPPLKVVVPGRVFRFEAEDAAHSSVFHQVEGFVVQEGVTFAHLKATLEGLFKNIFGPQAMVRFRPNYFPFTEPSAEIDLQCQQCKGAGCRLCKYTGWLEILGAGMIHPTVLQGVGINPKKYSGFAFGMGVERLAMIYFGVSDIRSFLRSDVSFLAQFPQVI